jgi:hypothetical protein
MKRMLLVILILACATARASQPPPGQAEAARTRAIFIGWVDISPDDWMALGYENKQPWVDLIKGGNQVFQQLCRRSLKEYEILGASDRLDEGAAGGDLRVTFTDVRFDVNTYALHAAIHFIDSKTATELAVIPTNAYRGGRFSVVSCLNGDLEKLAQRVAKEIQRLEKSSKKPPTARPDTASAAPGRPV